MVFENPSGSILFTVMDKDMVSDDEVGRGTLELGALMGNPGEHKGTD